VSIFVAAVKVKADVRHADVRCWEGGEMLKGRHEESHFVLDFVRAGNAPNRSYSGNERLTPGRDRISRTQVWFDDGFGCRFSVKKFKCERMHD
jgi:hypothetical protein